MRRMTPILMISILGISACGTPPAEDDVAGSPAGTEAAPSEELGSAVGLGGVAAYRGADADRDERLNSEEFSTWFDESGEYDRWDADSDGAVSEDEFYTSAFAVWDRDGDQRLSEAEWQQGTAAWLNSARVGTWDDWDADANGFVSPAEYNRELHEHNLYDTLDQNVSGILEPAEMGDAWFRSLDSNRDTQLDQDEWRAWSSDSL